jgi:ADP-ribosylglycohydrolase
MTDTAMQDIVEKEIALSVKQFARKYPHAGYGHNFKEWLRSDSLESYGSFGNGSAMRVSFAGWYASSLEEAQLLAHLSARITHSHELGIKGAVVVASCIYLLKTGHNKEDIRKYVSEYYNIDFTLDEIRPSYSFDVTCEGSVPQAIVAFLENEDFENVIKAAISIGGDSDTIAAIAGSIAELYYPVPGELTGRAIHKLDNDLKFAVKTITEVLLVDGVV